jgi:hypothetical protein
MNHGAFSPFEINAKWQVKGKKGMGGKLKGFMVNYLHVLFDQVFG